MRLTVATHNEHKLAEFARLMPHYELVALPQGSAAPVEDGESFAANALIKARAGAAIGDGPAIADDSGICVERLGGAPGIRSARWAGEQCDDAANLQMLIDKTEPGDNVKYVCAIAFCDPRSGTEKVFEATCRGTRAASPRGSDGFGYDPAVEPTAMPGRTMAELSGEEKDQISHRGKAIRALDLWLGER
jgi:XTP/dITP diphosphohydrolase